ncbi:anthranilate synthase component II [Gallaecimonas pentaromativorans]|uniref:Anthranilate synthase component 2/para-aminobenzoate synthetase component 2 n=1 Tax=Gallaecimonas pentaromativorans TaxID=584787 RepID=A0A3N1P963_9GAMM|nr:aminodeoxychorismate/anthranilate synthase component II [Gallaecimonas pentaromativorans]ROQ23320.1 anthranilate synthase component 2/para-aminobenzoate synthetase component 2 [Gallaecimonas pentaromativorans]
MLLVIDNYDSFTYNLVQYFQELGQQVGVVRNDAATLRELEAMGPKRLVISPGPCSPNEAGISLAAIEHFMSRLPVLGVCLGHQAIAQALGGQVVRAPKVMHGKTSRIDHDNSGLFAGLPNPLTVTRYHSLLVEAQSLPAPLRANAWTEEGLVMGFAHRELPLHGVQFHPEAILTEAGHELLANFLAL